MRDDPDDLMPDETTPTVPPRPQPARASSRWRVRLLIALGLLLLLVLCVPLLLLKSPWTLLRAASVAPATSVLPTPPAPPSAETHADGLDATMQVAIAGPYFLSELLPVDVSLTNHTQQTVDLLEQHTTADLCHDSALMARLTAGGDPSVAFPPIPVGFGCDHVLQMTQVQPAETLTIHQYVPLTRSGAVTLSMQSARVCTPATPPCASATSLPNLPLNGHWPTVQLQVQPQVPPDRTLILQEQPGHVLIEAPAGAQAQLLAMQSMSCDRYLAVNGARWTPLATNLLVEPTCPTAHPSWVYIVSAPGFSIVSGRQPA